MPIEKSKHVLYTCTSVSSTSLFPIRKILALLNTKDLNIAVVGWKTLGSLNLMLETVLPFFQILTKDYAMGKQVAGRLELLSALPTLYCFLF
jgi:hypothetical protein